MSRESIRLGAVSVCAAGLLLLGPAAGAATVVVDRETVQVELSPTGSVDRARLFTQLTATGQGRVTVDVVTPLVGQLTTTLPSNFTDLEAPRADIAGDGRGGTQMTWTMVLFTPIGATTQSFGWKAQVKDGSVPAATIQAAPVPPTRKPELKTGQDGYAAGAKQGQELAAGSELLDANMKRLVAGTSQLIDGLSQLASGTGRLASGLSIAAPGASRLAAGLDKAHAGAGKLARGLGSSSKNLASGSADLHAGLAKISDGLSQLGDSQGLPAAHAASLALRDGVDKILAGIGSSSDPASLLGGISQLSSGTSALSSGVTSLSAGADALVGTSGLPAARGGVDSVKGGLDGALAAGGPIDQLAGGVSAARASAGCTGDPTCAARWPPWRPGSRRCARRRSRPRTGWGRSPPGCPRPSRGSAPVLRRRLLRCGAGSRRLLLA